MNEPDKKVFIEGSAIGFLLGVLWMLTLVIAYKLGAR